MDRLLFPWGEKEHEAYSVLPLLVRLAVWSRVCLWIIAQGFPYWPSGKGRVELLQQVCPETDGMALLSFLVPSGSRMEGRRRGQLGWQSILSMVRSPILALRAQTASAFTCVCHIKLQVLKNIWLNFRKQKREIFLLYFYIYLTTSLRLGLNKKMCKIHSLQWSSSRELLVSKGKGPPNA